jgi:predicted phosphodiesterase
MLLVIAAAATPAAAQRRPTDPAAEHAIPEFTVPPVRSGVTYVRCLALGDMGTGHPDQHRVAKAMSIFAKREGTDFILTLGDNFYENGVTSVDDPQWKTKFEDVYDAAPLAVPVYATLGNHDYRGNIQAQIDYSTKNARWRMPSPYYSFSKNLDGDATVAFFAVDTTPLHLGSEGIDQQLAWLDKALGESKARWKVVFGHHPPYSHGDHGPDAPLTALLEPLFVKHKVDVYLAGHDHHLEMLKPIKDVHYVLAGGGAGPQRAYKAEWTDESYYTATLGGFIALRISNDELIIEFVRLDGNSQYAHTLHKALRSTPSNQ